jgi:thymidylate kinase
MKGAYIIGEPGAGKSTLVRALTDSHRPEWRRKPFAHAVYFDEGGRTAAVQIGGDHDQFPGTDRLSMSVQPRAIEWVLSAPAPAVFAEGDRLATAGFLAALEAVCDEWWLILLATPFDVARERRAGRGSDQNETWLRGRQTKVQRLAAAHPERLVALDGRRTPEELADRLRELPAFAWC